ncbi:hypothetical protein SDC9_107030 [bioreactor metagenome]|uniref:Uncharacterized protein n=1 Tax=bioreactor metagenome TaxID=1076179 RepID=A0A645B418_9ZZZZ
MVHTLAQRVDVVGHTGENIAGAGAVKVPQRQPVDFFADVPPQLVRDLLGDTSHQPALQRREQKRHAVQRNQNQNDPADVPKVDVAGTGDQGQNALKQFIGGACHHLRAGNGKDG